MRRTQAILMAAIALVFVAGCGASGGSGGALKTNSSTTVASSETTAKSDTTAGSDSTTTTEDTTDTTADSHGDTISVEDWADDFCGNFGSWIDDIKSISNDAVNGITPGDDDGAKQAVVDLFAKASDRTQTLIDDIDSGGVPDIDNGDELIQDLEAKFQDFDDAIQSAKSDAEDLDTSDVSGFQSDKRDLVDRFQAAVTKVGNSFRELNAKYPSRNFQQALSSSCKF